MKDKRTYKYEKEHGEDMTHENEISYDVTAITDQYRADLKKYQDRESLYIALKHKNGWMNVRAPKVIKTYINERSYITS